MKNILHSIRVTAVLTGMLAVNAAAAELIGNGGFETGFTGWITDQSGEGTFHSQTGTSSPVTGFPVPAPPEGSTAAMTDAEGPGSHVLYQSFTLLSPVGGASLSFDLFVGNRVEVEPTTPETPIFYSPDTLAIDTPVLNQQARVDILAGGADPFSLAPGDILRNLFQTEPGDDPVSGYRHFSFNVTDLLNTHLGETLILRFAEADNVGIFNFGVDNVSLQTRDTSDVPEGSALLPGFLTIAGMCWAASRKRH